VAPDVRELCLTTKFRPNFIDRLGGRVHEIDAPVVMHRWGALGLGVPDLLDLEQSTISSAHVVLAELQRGPPTGSFELSAVVLLQDGAVLALAR
jgi:hypothetical protein